MQGLRLTLGAVTAALVLVSGCGASSAGQQADNAAAPDDATTTDFRIVPNPAFGARDVPPRTPVEITVQAGTLKSVQLMTADGEPLGGEMAEDERSWRVTDRLEFGTSYLWSGTAVDDSGKSYPITGSFDTIEPAALVTVTSNVRDGGVYPKDLRIAMTFSAPVQERDMVVEALELTASPPAKGEWVWSGGDTVLTWLPADDDWRPDTKIKIDAHWYGLHYGHGRYGARDMQARIRIDAG